MFGIALLGTAIFAHNATDTIIIDLPPVWEQQCPPDAPWLDTNPQVSGWVNVQRAASSWQATAQQNSAWINTTQTDSDWVDTDKDQRRKQDCN